jgi:hypothetical protein
VRPRAVRVEPLASPAGTGAANAVRVVARDWPSAVWVAVPLLAAGLVLLVFAVAGGHAVEGGGAAVFLGLGLLAAWLWLGPRRDLVVAPEADLVRVRGRQGAGPLGGPVDLALPAGVLVEVEPFPVPEGAPDLPDRGGDLVLVGGGARIRLARRAGPGWREELERAAAVVRAALPQRGPGSGVAPVQIDGPPSAA